MPKALGSGRSPQSVAAIFSRGRQENSGSTGMTAEFEGGVGSNAVALIDGIHPNANDFDLDGLLIALQAMRAGDFTVRLPGNRTDLAGKIADTFNDIVAANQRMAQQLELVGQAVGRE